MATEVQERVQEEVQRTRRRSRWTVAQVLAALGVARSSYYRRRRDRPWNRDGEAPGRRAVQVYEALDEERQAVVAYARGHPELRHRELAWRMVDEDVACVSPSTVYRILSRAGLVWR